MSETETLDAVLIAGPTASGKSDIAMKLAERVNGTIINADAMQVYDVLRVLTARPSLQDEARVPHRLYGHVSPAIAYSAAAWAEEATAAAREVTEEGRLPIFVGGTGLYFSVLSEGLSPIPEIPDEVRDTVRSDYEREGLEALFKKVDRCDPASAARIGATDPQRLMRALEVYEATGEPLTEWQARPKERPFKGRFARIVVETDRAWVYERIENRFDHMVEEGALDEIKALMAMNLHPDLPAMKALGVPDLIAVQRGLCPIDDAIRDIKTKTRRFAKRQMTWFRNQMISWERVDAQHMESIIDDIFTIILDSGLTLPE